jgi:hypothetical protein
MKMKTMKMVLLAFVLLATACSQNTTTTTVPPPAASGYSIDSNFYVKINFNGQTLHYYTAIATENGLSAPVAYPISVTPSGYCDFEMGAITHCNPVIYHADFTFQMHFNKVNTTGWIGTYKGTFSSPFADTTNAGSIRDLNNSIVYTVNKNSTATIVNMNATSVIGTFTCTLQNGSTSYPATGSFCLKKAI